ncbi:hypothetical protein CsSME_00003995 [Camellia sinensis var. sinensis]
MFSSNNSCTNPFPPSFHHHLSPPHFVGHDGPDIFLLHHHHHHPDPLLGDWLWDNFPVIDTISSSTIAASKQETTVHHCSSFPPPQNVLPRKRAGKKDRHSKIRTARGLRDRRVRLSIDIASKFFGLQDMLGFDKPSKALDWLLTKSKTAINEVKLMQKKHSLLMSSPTSECEQVSGGANENSDDNGGIKDTVSKIKPLMNVEKDKKVQQQQHRAAFHLLSRESRAMARARARERTREKMCTRRLNDPKEVVNDSSPPILNRSTCLSQIEAYKGMDSNNHMVLRSGLTEDSVVKPSSVFNGQKDVSFPK